MAIQSRQLMFSTLLFFFFFFFLALSDRIHAADGFRTHLTHVDSDSNFTKLQILQRSLERSERRKTTLTRYIASAVAKPGGKPIRGPVHAGEGEFLISLAIGNPSVPFNAIVDTGSDLIWSQCQPCEDCFHQTTHIYDPSASITSSKIPCSSSLCKALPYSGAVCKNSDDCDYVYTYGDNSITKGYLARETFTFTSSGGSDNHPREYSSLHNVGFGCGNSNRGIGFNKSTGLFGLGRGDLSFTSQMNYSQYSYCLTEYGGSKRSPIFFGSTAGSNQTTIPGVQTTPFNLENSQEHPSFFYLNLLSISVGEKKVRVPAAGENPRRGLIIDSGTSVTFLDGEAYRGVKYALLSLVNKYPPAAYGTSRIGLDLCFTVPKSANYSELEPDFPEMVFNLEGADWVIPMENYMIKDGEDGVFCLAMAASSGVSIFGNFQQQNFLVQFDLDREALSFAPAHCDRL